MAAAKGGPGVVLPQSFSEFIPSPKDQGSLSLFQVTDESDAAVVAAAIRFNQGTISACHMAVADVGSLEAQGLRIKKNSGGTYHPAVNDLHYEVEITSIADLNKVVQVFLEGDYYRIEQPRVHETLQDTAKTGKIDLESVVDKINGSVATRTLELVKSKHLAICPHP